MITLQYSAFGEPAEQLTSCVVDATSSSAESTLGSGQVRLLIRFSPIHPSDLNLIQGTYGERPELPAIPGGEASAIVDAIADDVDDLAVGDHVVLRRRVGAWREMVVVDVADCFRVPASIELSQASMLVINPATALRMLSDFTTLKPGDWVLQNAANSAVGRCVIQLARAMGLRTVNLVRRESLIEELSALGADAVVIDNGDKDTTEQVRQLTADAPARLALNAVGGDSALRLMDWLAPGATHVTYGAMGKRPLKVPNRFLIFKNLQLRGFWLTEWQRHAGRETVDGMFSQLATYMAESQLNIPVAKVYGPHQCTAAMTAATGDSRNGKILFEFNPTNRQLID